MLAATTKRSASTRVFKNVAGDPPLGKRALLRAAQWPWLRSPIRLPRTKPASPLKMAEDMITIAIEGCCHGELDNIYGALQHLEKVEGKKIDLLISCGDFQAVRNMDDLETMACPPKYRDMQSFYKYYSGEKKPPFPTLFIGGNHEAANHLWELYHGGWAAPDIMFLGFTGCLRFGGVRIGGLSGIYKQGDYKRGHTERLPYDASSMRSIYHVRDFEVYRLMQLKRPLDIFLSHDWPTNIARHGDTATLIKRKPFLAKEIESGELGSPAGEQLLHTLKPSYWFSAHMHTKFPAVVQHPGGGSTRFLALDKCLPGRDFLQLVTLPAKGPKVFEYDPEWLAIMRTTHGTMNLTRQHRPLPGMGSLRRGADTADVQFVERVLSERGTNAVPLNFQTTAPAYNPKAGTRQRGRMPEQHTRNPQTVELLNMLQLPYNLDHNDHTSQSGSGIRNSGARQQGFGGPGPNLPPPPGAVKNPEEIDLDDLGGDDVGGQAAVAQPPVSVAYPEEIDLDCDDVQSDDGQGQEQARVDVVGMVANPAKVGSEADQGVQAHLNNDPMFKPLDLM